MAIKNWNYWHRAKQKVIYSKQVQLTLRNGNTCGVVIVIAAAALPTTLYLPKDHLHRINAAVAWWFRPFPPPMTAVQP
jgi:hypothetical protein